MSLIFKIPKKGCRECMYPRNCQMLLRVVDAHNEELRKLGVRVPTGIHVDQVPGQEPPAFLVELVLDGYQESHLFNLGEVIQ